VKRLAAEPALPWASYYPIVESVLAARYEAEEDTVVELAEGEVVLRAGWRGFVLRVDGHLLPIASDEFYAKYTGPV
jgi:hypothetical protein